MVGGTNSRVDLVARRRGESRADVPMIEVDESSDYNVGAENEVEGLESPPECNAPGLTKCAHQSKDAISMIRHTRGT